MYGFACTEWKRGGGKGFFHLLPTYLISLSKCRAPYIPKPGPKPVGGWGRKGGGYEEQLGTIFFWGKCCLERLRKGRGKGGTRRRKGRVGNWKMERRQKRRKGGRGN